MIDETTRTAASTDTAPTAPVSHVAQSIAPEDLRPGQYVAPLQLVFETWLDPTESRTGRVEMYQVQVRTSAEPHPVRVVDVCLPFVLVRDPKGAVSTLDVRSVRLARISDQFGRTAFGHAPAKADNE